MYPGLRRLCREFPAVDWNQRRGLFRLSYGLGYSRRSDYKFCRALAAAVMRMYTAGFVLTRYGNYLQLSPNASVRKGSWRDKYAGYRRGDTGRAGKRPNDRIVSRASLSQSVSGAHSSVNISVVVVVVVVVSALDLASRARLLRRRAGKHMRDAFMTGSDRQGNRVGRSTRGYRVASNTNHY